MTEITLDKVLAEARQLSLLEQGRLIRMLKQGFPTETPHQKLERLAAEQGTGPVNFAELRKLGEFFPAEESIDELVDFIRASRSSGPLRELEPQG